MDEEFVLALLLITVQYGEDEKSAETAKKKKKKDIRDYSDAEMEEPQWEENEEEKDPDDYAWKKPKEPNVMFDPTKPIDNAEDLLKQSKKGQVLMLFVQVAGDITKDEAEKITGRWQSSLFNGNIQIQRYMIEDTKAIFLLQDGSLAWDVKDFLINQPECRSVEIEQKTYWGKAAKQSEKDAEDKKLDDLRKKREKDPIVPKPVDEKQKDDKENEEEKDPDDYAWKKPKQPNVMFAPTKPIDNVEDLLKQSKKDQVLIQVAGASER